MLTVPEALLHVQSLMDAEEFTQETASSVLKKAGYTEEEIEGVMPLLIAHNTAVQKQKDTASSNLLVAVMVGMALAAFPSLLNFYSQKVVIVSTLIGGIVGFVFVSEARWAGALASAVGILLCSVALENYIIWRKSVLKVEVVLLVFLGTLISFVLYAAAYEVLYRKKNKA